MEFDVSCLSKFSQHRILVVGDLMLDEYVWGDVERISPEAPVPVVLVNRETYTLGGAGNVVNNLAALGAKVSVAGVVGEGRYGRLMLKRFAQLGVDAAGVRVEPGRPTIRKTRIISGSQHVIRIDRESRKKVSSDTLEAIWKWIETRILDMDAIVMSDYGKGLLTDELLYRITTCAKIHGKIILADPKGLDYRKYAGVDVLTPNKKEAAQASGMEIRDDQTLAQSAQKLLQTIDIQTLLITCGKDGMVLFERGKEPYKIRSEARQVYDVSGAGDTVISVLALALASGASLKDAACIANAAAGIVVGKIGTATVSKKELRAALSPYPDPASAKYKSPAELAVLADDLKRQGKRIVLTNGCFDLLHAGHVMLFAGSKKLGDVLMVAIDDDESVRNLKGPGRPVIRQHDRVRMLSSLDSVDWVTVFSSGELTTLIETIRPDVLTKGSNYMSEEVFGHEIVEQYGGRVVLLPIIENISSSGIIHSIMSNQAINLTTVKPHASP